MNLPDLMCRQEELLPELAAYETIDRFGPMIKHPLCFSVCHCPQMNALVNEQYRYKLKAAEESLNAEDFEEYVYLHERPYRAYALRNIAEQMGDVAYWQLVGSVWRDSENVGQWWRHWRWLWTRRRPHRDQVMDEQERQNFAGLPDTLTLYRGTNVQAAARGLSWALSRERAEWFAKRFLRKQRKMWVFEAQVAKADAVAYFAGRNEGEIVVHPSALRLMPIKQVC